MLRRLLSGRKEENKPTRFGPDIFWWRGGLHREGVGAQNFGMSLEAQETKHFGGISRDFGSDIPEVPEKEVCVQFFRESLNGGSQMGA